MNNTIFDVFHDFAVFWGLRKPTPKPPVPTVLETLKASLDEALRQYYHEDSLADYHNAMTDMWHTRVDFLTEEIDLFIKHRPESITDINIYSLKDIK